MYKNPHKITYSFEQALCDYTGAPYAVAVDNCSNALFLALQYELHVTKSIYEQQGLLYFGGNKRPVISIPKHTYMSVPCAIIHAGCAVEFEDNRSFGFPERCISSHYRLGKTNIFDSALCFSHCMYVRGSHMCLSFTGPFKHLKLGKGGAILTDNEHAYKWFKKARFSGRAECSYHDDNFDDNPVIGWNFYMMPEIAARGLLLMGQFYDKDGKPKSNPDLELPYPDLSRYKLWQ